MSKLFDQLEEKRKFYNENKDCCVKMFAAALNMSYENAWHLANRHGRQPQKGMSGISIERVLISQGCVFRDVTKNIRANYKTVKSMPAYRNGTYIIFTSSHVLCLRGGAFHDWSKNRQLRIEKVLFISKDLDMSHLPDRTIPIQRAKAERSPLTVTWKYTLHGKTIKNFTRKPSDPSDLFIRGRKAETLGKIKLERV